MNLCLHGYKMFNKDFFLCAIPISTKIPDYLGKSHAFLSSYNMGHMHTHTLSCLWLLYTIMCTDGMLHFASALPPLLIQESIDTYQIWIAAYMYLPNLQQFASVHVSYQYIKYIICIILNLRIFPHCSTI